MAYTSSSTVAALCVNILSGASDFSASSSPTSTAVDGWISSGCSVIDTYLSSKKYDVPIPSGAAAYSWLTNLNTLYAAALVETSRTNITLGPGERTRGRVMLEQFWDELKMLVSMDLTSMGVTRSSKGSLYVGGISEADKDTYEDDSDRVAPRFERGMLDFPGTLKPTKSAAS